MVRVRDWIVEIAAIRNSGLESKKMLGFCVEKFKEDVMKEKFRQDMLNFTSAQTFNIDESKRPAYKPVNESFRKLAVD